MKDQEKSAQGQVSKSEMELASIAFENAGDAIFWITPDARIVNCNPAACRLLGYTKQELIEPFHSRYSAEDEEGSLELDLKLVKLNPV